MKAYTLQFKDIPSLNHFITTHSLKESNTLLIQIFSGIIDAPHILNLTSTLKAQLPKAHIIGTTTSGEIAGARMYEEGIVISFSTFDTTTIRSNLYNLNEDFDLQQIKDELIRSDTKALIIFSDGLKSDAEELLNQLYHMKSDMVVAGGRAGDNLNFANTYVFNESHITDRGCVIATLSGSDIIANSDYMLNWTPIGKEMVVTKVKNNVLYELDHTPILDIYKKYLGESITNNFLEPCMEFPLIINRNSVHIARGPIVIKEDGALVFAGNFELGDNVQFSFGDVEDIIDSTKTQFDKFKRFPAEAIYVYSCAARKTLMGKTLENELNILESLAPTAGFFTYGEYFHASKVVELLNVTTTFLTLSETTEIKDRTLLPSKVTEYDVVKKALIHLIKVTTQELENISTHDILTSLHNRNQYLKKIALKVKSASRYHEHFGLILIDIDHFKLINDNYGHMVGDDVLKKFAAILMQSVREDDFVARWGGEEFVIIANYTTIASLELLTKKLQKNISESSFEPLVRLTASFGLTVYIEGDTNESLFKRVDNALYVAKQSGRNCYVIG
jgi:diguanylate cyclase (GGDEF)-like protein